MTSQYGAYALHAGLARLHALCVCTSPRARVRICTRSHAQTNKYYVLLFRGNTRFAKAPECYIIRTVPVL